MIGAFRFLEPSDPVEQYMHDFGMPSYVAPVLFCVDFGMPSYVAPVLFCVDCHGQIGEGRWYWDSYKDDHVYHVPCALRVGCCPQPPFKHMGTI